MKNSSLRATGRRTRKSRRACAQLLTFSRGCEWVLAKLEKVYDGLTTDAASDARASDLLIDSCAPDDSELGRLALDYARRGLAGDKTPLPSADATSAARLVDHRSAESFQFLSPLRENERLEIARRRAAVALPAAADLDRTLRYEKTITQS
ncbi:MAG TPA: hypothetical protein VG815_20555 [Chloroflexota bacterium]|jgi:hypothetical protein|nr:hypothetical protein [Chloroflexota bacterium]